MIAAPRAERLAGGRRSAARRRRCHRRRREIDAVEVELEDLLLRDSHSSAKARIASRTLRPKRAVVEEDVARELLGDGERPGPTAEPDADADGAARPIGSTPDASGSACPRPHHRLAHDRRDAVVRQPLAEARPHRHHHRSVCGADADHLAEIVPANQLLIGRKLADRDRDRHDQGDRRHHHRIDGDLEARDENAPEARWRGGCHQGLAIGRPAHAHKKQQSRLTAA